MVINLDQQPAGTDREGQVRSKKPKLSRASLQHHGIRFENAILPFNLDNEKDLLLPPHVESLRCALLMSFEALIHRHLENDLKAECESYLNKQEQADRSNRKTRHGRTREVPEHFTVLPPDDAYAPESTWSGELRTRVGDVDKHLKAARDATQRVENGEKEFAWTFYLLQNIFREYRRVKRDRSRYQNLFDQWRLEPNICWLDHKIEDGSSAVPKLSSPKPDFTYGFPIFKRDDELPRGLVDFDCAKNFSLDHLKKLRRPNENGMCIRSSLNGGLYKASQGQCRDEELGSYELTCFPWAVVEVKHHNVTGREVEFCYCQAVNGSAVALKILKSVFMEAYGSIQGDLPPIIAFTCVGPDLRVWLTYIDHKLEPGQEVVMMKCIFATTLELRWGVMAAREIVKNMHLWASRVLKPRISAALSTIHAINAARISESNDRPTVRFAMKKGKKSKQEDDLDFNPPSLLRRVSTLTEQLKPSGSKLIRRGISKLKKKKNAADKTNGTRPALASTATEDFAHRNNATVGAVKPNAKGGSSDRAKSPLPHGPTDNDSESRVSGMAETLSVAETDGSAYITPSDEDDSEDESSEYNQSTELRREIQDLNELNQTFLEQDYPSDDPDDSSFEDDDA